MTTVNLESAFAFIREQREKLNADDDKVMEMLRQIEAALVAIRPGVPADVECPPPRDVDGIDAYWLIFGKRNGQWRIMWAQGDEDDEIPLTDTPRETRAHVFLATEEGPSAIELLIVGIADAIEKNIKERQPALERARSLIAAFESLEK